MFLFLIVWALVGLFSPTRRRRRQPPPPTEPKPGRAALTVPESAYLLNVSCNKVWALIASGDLPSFKVGRKRLISRQAVDDFMARGGTRATGRQVADA